MTVKVPVEDDKTESENEVKREYVGDESDSNSFVGSSCSSELDEEIVREKGAKRLKRASLLSSDSIKDEPIEVENKLSQEMNGLIKTEQTEEVVEAEVHGEELSGENTDSDEDRWPTHEERDVERKKKADEILDESDEEIDEEWRREEWKHQEERREDENERVISQGDISQAKFVLRNITSRISLLEETAIRRGVKLSGPPLEFATTHLDEYARKFRWPQHVRNLRNTNFSQDPTEILEDFKLLATTNQSEPGLLKRTERDVLQDSAFAQVPRPMVSLAADALYRLSRKRKRTTRENAPSALTLLNFARVGGQFCDDFVESLLSVNGQALQGIDSKFSSDIDKRCWSSLPTKKKPIANWRFVLEHVRRTMGRSTEFSDAVYPPMKQETLKRITNRLKKLHGCTTQHEENDIFERNIDHERDDATKPTPEE